jgi:uncharacterized protein
MRHAAVTNETSSGRSAAAALPPAEIGLGGEALLLDHRGALFLPDYGLLAVSDLHLEKGAAYARRGVFLPPYDTIETLARLQILIAHYAPRIVVSLGDSFHDRAGAAEMIDPLRDELALMMKGRDWVWIRGNHDPDAPAGLPGETYAELQLNALTFRHQPLADGANEVSGHLHPCARIVARGRSVRRRCFAADASRLVMPAFGALTGSLNVLDRAFAELFSWDAFRAHMMGSNRVFPIAKAALRRD